MKEKRMTIREFVKAEAKGQFSNPDVDTQIEAGWYDWFCYDKALAKKTKTLTSKLRDVLGTFTGLIDLDKNYVFFKNNCPLDGSLYDDFRICDMKTGDVIFTISPAVGYTKTKGQSEVWGRINDFKGPIVTGTWSDVLKFFAEN